MLFLCIKRFFSVKRTEVEIQSTDGVSHGKEWNNVCILVGDHGTAVNAFPRRKRLTKFYIGESIKQQKAMEEPSIAFLICGLSCVQKRDKD